MGYSMYQHNFSPGCPLIISSATISSGIPLCVSIITKEKREERKCEEPLMNTALPSENRVAAIKRVCGRISVLSPFRYRGYIYMKPEERKWLLFFFTFENENITQTKNSNHRLFQPINRMLMSSMDGESRLLQSSNRK